MTAISPMRWWHVAAVSRIERETFPGDAWSPEQFWQELAQQVRSYVVAVVDGQVVGYGGISAIPPDCDLQTIAVDLAHRRARIASQVLEALTEEAVARGCTHMVLEVRADNSGAIAMYERHGFERLTVRRHYYPDGVDAVIMRRRLV